MNKKRPVNLNLTTIKFPSAAIASILHRISGLLLFLFIPLLLWLLNLSLDPQGFNQLHSVFANPITKLFTWALLAGLIYHLIAGIRHLFMDMHIAEDKKGGKISAIIVILLSFIFILFAGIWLWYTV